MKKIALILFCLLLFLAVCLGIGPYLLHLKKVQDRIVTTLSKEFGSTITIRDIRWHWLPLPRISLLDAKGGNSRVEFLLPEIVLYPSWASLSHLDFSAEKILLIRPRVLVKARGETSAAKEFLLTATKVVVQDGTLRLDRKIKLPGIDRPEDLVFSFTRSEVEILPKGVRFISGGKTSFCDSLELSGTYDILPRHYDIDFNFRGLALQKGISSALGGLLVPTAPEVNGVGHIEGTGLDEIKASLQGEIPCFTVKPEERQLLVNCGFADLLFEKSGNDMFLKINRMEAREPELLLHGIIERNVAAAGPPQWHIDLSGENLDLSGIRKGVLTLWGDNKIAAKVCEIVQGGRARKATYRFDGPLSDLKHLHTMTITADVETAEIHVPKADLQITGASGPIVIKDSVLTGSGLSGSLNESRGRNCSLLLGLGPKNHAFKLDIDINAVVAELPAVLHKLVHHALFNRELDRFGSLTGTAEGHLTIGDSLKKMAVTVSVTGMKAGLLYDRISWPASVEEGRLVVRPGAVEWHGIRGVLGPHQVRNTEGRVFWDSNGVHLDIEQLDGVIAAGPLYTELAARSMLPKKIKKYLSSAQGMLDITEAKLTGPAMAPEKWRYNVHAGLQELSWSSPLVPETPTIREGTALLDNDELVFSGCAGLFLGQPITIEGRLKHVLLENWHGRLRLAGTVNEKIGAWVRQHDWLPAAYFPRLPCTLQDFTIDWGGRDGLHIKGGVLSGSGKQPAPMFFVDLSSSPERLLLKELTLTSPRPGEQGRLMFSRHSRPPRQTSLQWQGTLNARTLEALFANNFIRSGHLQGDLRMEMTDKPGSAVFRGALDASGLHWHWGEAPEAAVALDAHIRGNGDTLTVDTLQLDTGSGPLTVRGAIGRTAEGFAMNMMLVAHAMSREQTLHFLTDLNAKTKRLTGFGVRPEGQAGLASWDLTGKIDFQVGAYTTTFNPPAAFQENGRTVYTLNQLSGTVDLLPGTGRTTHIEHAELCGLTGIGTMYPEENSNSNRFDIFTPPDTPLLFQSVLPCLGFKQDLLEGDFTMVAALQGEPGSWTDGKLEIHSSRGRILRMKLLSKILSVVNVTDLFTSNELAEMNKKGFGYSDLEMLGEVNDNQLDITKVIIRGEGLNLFGKGKLDLQSLDTDFVILVAPLKSLDAIVGNVPLVGQAVGGKNTALISIPVGVTGNIKDPKVIILAPQAVGEAIIDFFKSTLNLPFRLLNPLLPKQPAADGGETPAPAAGQ